MKTTYILFIQSRRHKVSLFAHTQNRMHVHLICMYALALVFLIADDSARSLRWSDIKIIMLLL